MRAVYDTILAVGPTNATVLIQGETGTGKELVAKAVHYNSTRADNVFVKVDCGALAETLLESELFGHVKGAYTGAVRERAGRFELAHEGTVFLDEVQNLSMPLQAKLLRVVQEGRFEKVGGTETMEVDVRIVAATNEDLARLVGQREFRKDLYYRLNVIPIQLPPLAERRGDVPLLARSFIERFAERHGKDVTDVSQEALDRLMGYDWPGNVRELENIVEQAVVFSRGRTIEADEIRLPRHDQDRGSGFWAAATSRPLRKALEAPEKKILTDALARTNGNKKEAAKLLGISRSALYEKLKRHGLSGKRKGST
ncbi:MAG: sigma-54 interaction domain-containing protein [Planctomycetota bacterium]